MLLLDISFTHEEAEAQRYTYMTQLVTDWNRDQALSVTPNYYGTTWIKKDAVLKRLEHQLKKFIFNPKSNLEF